MEPFHHCEANRINERKFFVVALAYDFTGACLIAFSRAHNAHRTGINSIKRTLRDVTVKPVQEQCVGLGDDEVGRVQLTAFTREALRRGSREGVVIIARVSKRVEGRAIYEDPITHERSGMCGSAAASAR